MQALVVQKLVMFEQRGEICPALETCAQLMPCSLLPQLPLVGRSKGLPESPVVNSHASCLEALPVAFKVFPRCVTSGGPIVLHECDDDS